MKTTLLILLGFAILAVSMAKNGGKNARDLENPTSKIPVTDSDATGDEAPESADDSGNKKKPSKSKRSAAKGDDNADATETSKPKKGSKSVSADTSKPKKGSKSAPVKKQKKTFDTDISIDADDILKDQDEDTVDIDSDDVKIPSMNDLTSEDDPVELAEKIRNITDKEKRQELIDELENLKDEHENILPSKFYAAAYAALDPKNAEKAAQYWQKNLDRAIEKAKNDMKKAMAKTKGGVGNAVGEARKLIQADPVGIALRKGQSFFLTALADATKNWGNIASLGHGAVGNASRFIRAATFPIDGLPILSDIKNNFHDFVEEQAQRGQNLSELFANDASSALNYAAKDADEQANKREQVLRKQFSSKRNL